MISIMALVLVISIGFLVPKAAAQSDKYSKMAPVDQYLMEGNAEILLARSAAPDSISSDATILVLGWQGYETAVRGKPQPQGNLGTDGTFTYFVVPKKRGTIRLSPGSSCSDNRTLRASPIRDSISTD
jgi:hypothetical protein